MTRVSLIASYISITVHNSKTPLHFGISIFLKQEAVPRVLRGPKMAVTTAAEVTRRAEVWQVRDARALTCNPPMAPRGLAGATLRMTCRLPPGIFQVPILT